jgi:hypothetical protein
LVSAETHLTGKSLAIADLKSLYFTFECADFGISQSHVGIDSNYVGIASRKYQQFFRLAMNTRKRQRA